MHQKHKTKPSKSTKTQINDFFPLRCFLCAVFYFSLLESILHFYCAFCAPEKRKEKKRKKEKNPYNENILNTDVPTTLLM